MLPVLTREKNADRVFRDASGDKRFRILEVHMKKHQFRQDALIEVLHKAQELDPCRWPDAAAGPAHRVRWRGAE